MKPAFGGVGERVGGVGAVAEAGEVDDAVAPGDGLGEQALHVAGGGAEALVLGEDVEVSAAECAVEDVAPFAQVNGGGAEEDRWSAHGCEGVCIDRCKSVAMQTRTHGP